MEEDKIWRKNFFIAGVQYHEYKNVYDVISEGDMLLLEPDPMNKFDPNAVKILFDNFDKQAWLGFVPNKYASEVCALNEAEIELECELIEFNKTGKPWEMFKVEVREVEDE